MSIAELKYGNTNTFFIDGLLLDTGYAGTLRGLWKAMKENGLSPEDIRYVMATHYHPDHSGLTGELAQRGAKLLLIDVQKDFVHFQDRIFRRERIRFTSIDESRATVISCHESRDFLKGIGIDGEVIHTPSHSPDSVSLVLDSGDCFVGDLEPFEHIEGYENNSQLKDDWARLLSRRPGKIFFAHRPTAVIGNA